MEPLEYNKIVQCLVAHFRYRWSFFGLFPVQLAKLNIPDKIYNWVVNFLKERGHMTKYAGRTSAILYINASVVQGSGLGPTTFAITASDLETLDANNLLPKFAD